MHVSLQNFADVFSQVPFGRMAVNSMVVTLISVAGSLFVSGLAAHGFSRLEFAGRDTVFVTLLSALMVPGQLTVIPIFILMRSLGLVDSRSRSGCRP